MSVNGDLPDEVWMGKVQGQWPIQTFDDERMAIEWLKDERRPGKRKLWKVALTVLTSELEVVEVKPTLREIES